MFAFPNRWIMITTYTGLNRKMNISTYTRKGILRSVAMTDKFHFVIFFKGLLNTLYLLQIITILK